MLSEHTAIQTGIDHAYADKNAEDVVEDINKEYASVTTLDVSGDFIDLGSALDDAPVVRLVNNIIVQAYNQGASDIHIAPYREITIVRSRIDGDIVEQMSISPVVHSALITRIKILSGMHIAEQHIL